MAEREKPGFDKIDRVLFAKILSMQAKSYSVQLIVPNCKSMKLWRRRESV